MSNSKNNNDTVVLSLSNRVGGVSTEKENKPI